MVQGKATLVLDFGNSQTRGTVKYGRDSQQRIRERKFILSNSFCRVPDNYKMPGVYTEEDSSIMEMSCVSNGGKEMHGCYAHGEVVRVEFEPRNEATRPSATAVKYDSYHTVLSFGVALLKATRCIMEMTQCSNPSELDIEWNLVALLPPGDIEKGANSLTELLNSAKIKFKEPEISFENIKLSKVSVLPEGFCAYVGTVFERAGVVRDGYQDKYKGITLVLDVGAGTSDTLLIENSHVVDESKHTIELGGNNVMALIRRKIKDKLGFKPTEEDTKRAIECGIIKDGSKEINIVDIINDAKTETARKIVNDIRDFVEEISYNMRRVENLLLVGGGVLSGSVDVDRMKEMGYDSADINIKPFSQDIQEYISELAPNIAIMPMPVITKKSEDGKEDIKEEVSPRMLNIIGASIIANKLVG